MQAVGIIAISIGVWLIYAGITGVPPISTILAILQHPENASAIIAAAKEESKNKANNLTSGFSAPMVIKGFIAGKNPFSAYKMTDDFAAHKARGSAGGVDFAMPSGTPLPAVADGTVTFDATSGGAGNVVTLVMSNGYKSVYEHVQRATVVSGQKVTAGTIIALSGGGKGDPNPGDSTGAHLHWHIETPDGKRIDPIEWITSTTAPGIKNPLTPPNKRVLP